MEDLWFSGLRAIGRRPLDDNDVLTIEHLRHDRLFRLLFSLAGPLLFLAAGCAAAFGDETSVVEVLPFSGFVWSENHVAASWRRLPLLRRTFVRRGRA